MSEEPQPQRFMLFDGIGLAAGGVGVLLTAVLGFAVVPTFGKMFADFGGQLPVYTQLWFPPWVFLALSLIPLALVVDGVVRRTSARSRVLRMTVAIAAVFVMIPAFLVGMYLPIFTLAGKVQ